MTGSSLSLLDYGADPDHPGWFVSQPPADEMFYSVFGLVRVRAETGQVARIRTEPQLRHRNIIGGAHGGYLLALVDQCLFIGPGVLDIEGAVGGSTIDTSAQFMAPVRIGEPLEVVVEVLRVTRRLVFMRGLIEQAGTTALSFTGTIRRVTA